MLSPKLKISTLNFLQVRMVKTQGKAWMLYVNRRIGCQSMKLEVICALHWSYSARGMAVVADGRAVAVERLADVFHGGDDSLKL